MSRVHAPAQSAESRQPAAHAPQSVSQAGAGQAPVDNRPEAEAQRELAEAIETSPRVLQQKAFGDGMLSSPYMTAQRRRLVGVFGDMAESADTQETAQRSEAIEKEPIQRVKVNQEPMTHRQVAAVIADVDLSRGVRQKFIVSMVKDETDFDDQAGADAYILAAAAELGEPVDHEEVAARGAATEAAAASIIGGEVNRGEGDRDVEWRLVTRDKAEALKADLGIGRGHGTDQVLFAAWKDSFKGKDEAATPSTPVDAFSSTTLALAGGPAKFEKNSLRLKASAAGRVRELIRLAGLLEYEPILVFSETVTCAQCDAVASEFGLDVIHLGAGTH